MRFYSKGVEETVNPLIAKSKVVRPMTLVRWQPIYELNSLNREMNRLLDQLVVPHWDDPQLAKIKAEWGPAIEVQETEQAITIKAEVPGLTAQDLDVQVTRNAVSIAGERRQAPPTGPGYFRTELRYGQFQRIIPLRVKVNQEQVTAEFKDGILILTLPKAEDELRKVVKVNLSETAG
jgi:HSP20 family protein